jgi:predicted DCC family thiol-disulfide oxidoreductase YuxK
MDNIIFYDGDCGLCNSSVQFVLKHEKNNLIYFSALQSDFTKDFFKEHKLPQPDLSTFYFFTGNTLYQKSRAAFKVLPFLKWYLQPLIVFRLVPTFISDRVYNFIAKRRKKLAGKYCVIPTPENRNRFIE